MRILSRVPSAVLWLRGDIEDVRINLAREAEQRGCGLAELSLEDMRTAHDGIDESVYEVLTVEASAASRIARAHARGLAFPARGENGSRDIDVVDGEQVDDPTTSPASLRVRSARRTAARARHRGAPIRGGTTRRGRHAPSV